MWRSEQAQILVKPRDAHFRGNIDNVVLGRRKRRDNGLELTRVPTRPVVVAALHLKRSARAHLLERLGDVELFDIRDVVFEANIVLAPACSPQTISALRSAYPGARIVIVELEDRAFGISFPTPVKRLLRAGADSYLLADSIDELAEQLHGIDRNKPEALRQVELSQETIDQDLLKDLERLLAERNKVHPQAAAGD